MHRLLRYVRVFWAWTDGIIMGWIAHPRLPDVFHGIVRLLSCCGDF